jgi:tetratricopeptide (TPR) repeat protein
MSRWVLTLLAASVLPLGAQEQKPQQPPAKQGELKGRQQQPAATGKEEVPPEEDASLTTDAYSFNPLQAEKSLKIGNYYFKLGKYRAAEGRFRDATKWNDGYSEAWLRLGEVEERLKDPKAAKEAYQKYLEVASDAKNAAEIRKKVEKLK